MQPQYDVDLRQRPLQIQMKRSEYGHVIEVCNDAKAAIECMDYIALSSNLEQLGLISVQERNMIFQCVAGGQSPFDIFMHLMLPRLSFYHLISVFKMCGLETVSRKLLESKFQIMPGVGKHYVPNTDFVSKFYSMLKLSLDNNCFKNAQQHLSRSLQEMNCDLTRPHSIHKTQTSLDKKVTLSILQFQQTRSTLERFTLLHEMQAIVPENMDRRFLDMVYHGKMAVTAARDNHVELANDHIRAALTTIDDCPPCFGTISTLHDIVYVHRNLFNQNPSRKNLKTVLEWGHRALLSLTEQETQVQILWKRNFLQYMFLSLLRIDAYFNMYNAQDIELGDIHIAEDAITESDRISDNIPTRRKMILSLAKARLHELKKSSFYSILYAKEALALTQNGAYFDYETANITKYLHSLKEANYHRMLDSLVISCFIILCGILIHWLFA